MARPRHFPSRWRRHGLVSTGSRLLATGATAPTGAGSRGAHIVQHVGSLGVPGTHIQNRRTHLERHLARALPWCSCAAAARQKASPPGAASRPASRWSGHGAADAGPAWAANPFGPASVARHALVCTGGIRNSRAASDGAGKRYGHVRWPAARERLAHAVLEMRSWRSAATPRDSAR